MVMHMKKKKNAVLIALIVIFGVALIASSGYMIYRLIAEQNAEGDYQSLRDDYVSSVDNTNADEPKGTSQDATEVVLVDNPIDFKKLTKENKDIYSWIEIPDTNISYPVLQSDQDDNLYLDHDVSKNYSFPGSIYSQSHNTKDYSDRVTVLYGHNMLNGTMFADLYKFENESFFDSHPYFYVYTPDRKLTYEVVSAFEYDNRHIMNSFDFSDDKVFQSWIDDTQNPHSLSSNVRSDVKLDLDSKLLVLSTCVNVGDGRFLLEGVLVNDERTK